MPNLENLRKQAKLYLRWHREQHYPVAHMIRSLLPQFGHLTDRQVLESTFRLADAQELVAKKSGFESWAALVKGLDFMTDQAVQGTSGSMLLRAEPQLFVSNIEASCSFFEEKLGFKVSFKYGTPPFYAQVARDGASLNLRHVDQPVMDQNARTAEELLSATIIIDHAKPLFVEYMEAGVTFHQALRTEPWGARTFIIRDLDGNLICFAADTN
ncbi:MAG TPA: VOC family protein [Rhizobiaceae bacterium]|nr:VOC family protein [Rhizobiaceae bacterium]